MGIIYIFVIKRLNIRRVGNVPGRKLITKENHFIHTLCKSGMDNYENDRIF